MSEHDVWLFNAWLRSLDGLTLMPSGLYETAERDVFTKSALVKLFVEAQVWRARRASSEKWTDFAGPFRISYSPGVPPQGID